MSRKHVEEVLPFRTSYFLWQVDVCRDNDSDIKQSLLEITMNVWAVLSRVALQGPGITGL